MSEPPLPSTGDGPSPTSNSVDLSDGLLVYETGGGVKATNALIAELTTIRRVRVTVASGLAVLLVILAFFLYLTIETFRKQVDSAMPVVQHLVDPGHVVKPAALSPSGGTASGIAVRASELAASSVESGNVLTSIKVDLPSMAGSIVAVISILVIALVVISVSLLKATFGWTAQRDPEQQEHATKSDGDRVDDAIPLPAVEMVKSLADVIKAFSGKSK